MLDPDGGGGAVADGDELQRRLDAHQLVLAVGHLDEIHLHQHHLSQADRDHVLGAFADGPGDEVELLHLLLRVDPALEEQRRADDVGLHALEAVLLVGLVERLGGQLLGVAARPHERLHARIELRDLLHALVVVGGDGLAVEVDAVADDADLDALAIAQQCADLAHHFFRILLADHDQVAEPRVVVAPDEQGGAAFADSGDQELVAAAHLLHVGDVGLADGDARDVGDLDDLLLPDAEADGAAVRLRAGLRGTEEEQRGESEAEGFAHRVPAD